MIEPNSLHVPARAVQAAAKALWGDQWQTPMSRVLKINVRRVQRIAAAAAEDDTYLLPRGLLEDLLRELERKHFPLQRAYEDLKLIYDGG